MHDGEYRISGKHMIIDGDTFPVVRHPRSDGVLHLTVQIPENPMHVFIPLDDDAKPYIELLHNGGSAKFEVEPAISSFSGDQFSIPRPSGVSKVPEIISFDHPTSMQLRCHLEIFNDEPLPQRKTEVEPSNGA